MENLKALLESQPWEYNDGKRQQFINNMYFTFEEDGSLFDVGNFIFKDDNTVFIKNNEFWGELSAEHTSDEKIVLSGFIVHFDRDEIEMELTPTAIKDELPAADSIISAAMYGNINDIKRFLEKGADIDMTNEEGNTALMLACLYQHLELADFLLQQSADGNLCNNQDRNAMHMAISADSAALIKLLKAQGQSPIVDDTDENSLLFAIKQHVSVETIKALIETGASADNKQAGLLNTAMYSYHNGVMNPEENTKIVAYLLGEGGFDIDATDETTMRDMDEGNTALIYASAGGLINVLKLLIDKGADLHKTNHNNKTALDVICRNYNQGNEARIAEITGILNKAGLTKVKKDRVQESFSDITRLCDQGKGREAITQLKLIEGDILDLDFCTTYISAILVEPHAAGEEEIRKGIDKLNHFFGYDKIDVDSYCEQSIGLYLLLWDRLPERSEKLRGDKTWVEPRTLDLIKKHLDKGTPNKAALKKYLQALASFNRGLGLYSDNETHTTREAAKCSLKVYDKLIELEPIKYTIDKSGFLVVNFQGEMKEHFACLIALFRLEPDYDFSNLEHYLRDELIQRLAMEREHKENDTQSPYPYCYIPRNEFMAIAENHIAKNRRKDAEWYLKECSLAAPSNEVFWDTWFTNTIKDNDIARAYDNALDAVNQIDWNRNKIWNMWVAAHKACGTINEALHDAHSRLGYGEINFEHILPIYFLAREGANLNQKDNFGTPYLIRIIQYSSEQDIKYALEHYIDNVDAANKDGKTTFHYYCELLHTYAGYKSAVKILLAAGANPNALDVNGETCLFIHVREGNIDTIKFLLEECRLDKSIVNNEGLSVIQIAEQAGNSKLIELLDG